MPTTGNLHAGDMMDQVTRDNVKLGIQDLRTRSSILSDMEYKKEIAIVGGLYDVTTGRVEFYE